MLRPSRLYGVGATYRLKKRRENMSEIKLISVDVIYNCGEPGDIIYITTKWQNCGDKIDFNAKISADITFCGRQRRDECEPKKFKVIWTPFPNTPQWRIGDTWSTTGIWKIPSTWGGTFFLDISLLNEKNENIQFIGKNSIKTYFQRIGEIDVAWGYGRKKMLEQQEILSLVVNSETVFNKSINPKDFIDLGNLKLNKSYPAVCGYKSQEWNDFKPVLKIRKISDNSVNCYIGNNKTEYKVFFDNNKVKYSAENELCSFDVLFENKVGYVEIGIENISQKDDYEFLEFEIPSVAQSDSSDADFLNFYNGGRITKLSEALTQSFNFNYDTCNLISVNSSNGTFCIEAEDVENILHQSVVKKSGENKSVVLGVTIRNHIPANKSGLKSIPVNLKPLKLWISEENKSLISSEIIKQRLNTDCSSYKKLYKDTLVYKIMLDPSGQYVESNPKSWRFAEIRTLAEAKDIIMKVYNISNGMHQIVYLIGWQKGGHDFSYPYPYKLPFNPMCGTIEEFNSMRVELKKYNVELSLHDNFDDAYLSDEYELNRSNLCYDETGKLWKGWFWAGGMSYILDPKAYVESGEVTERIKAMISNYGIEQTYHLDVLSSEIRRYSFNSHHPLSAQEGIDAKLKIIEMFNKMNIDITSETLSLPFVGKIGYSQNIRCSFDGSLFYGDRVFPLTTLGFHGFTPYKVSANGTKESLLQSIAFGGACAIEFEDNINMTMISREIYISSLPMSKLAYSKVVDAKISSDNWKITYEDGCVKVDFKTGEYTIVFNGKVISNNYKTFMQLWENEFCYYSIEDTNEIINLPETWNNITVYELSEKGKTDSFKLNKATGFNFNFKSDTPYIIVKEAE